MYSEASEVDRYTQRLLLETLGEAMPAILSEASLSLSSFSESVRFAHLIDGYKLLQQLGHADHGAWLSARRQSAESTGAWTGTAAELWTALFLEHRRWRFADMGPDLRQTVVLDKLARQLSAALSLMESGGHSYR